MPLPALLKSWTVQKSYLVPPHDSTDANVNEYTHRKQLLFEVKEQIRGHWGWTVKGSVNALGVGGMDGVDRWLTPSDLKWGNTVNDPPAGWIVLERAGAAGAGLDFELLLALRNTSGSGGANADVLSVFASYAGFTGGSGTTRPTAVDELTIVDGGAWNNFLDGEQWALRLTSWASTDGTIGRLVVTYYDLTTTREPTVALYISGERAKNPVAAWTHPFVFTWQARPITFATLYAPAALASYGFDANPTPTAGWFTWYWATDSSPFRATAASDAAVGQRNFQQASNSLSLEGTLTSIAIVSESPGKTGRHGELFDLWFGRDDAMKTGDTFPADETALRLAIDDVVFPWDASVAQFV